MRVNGMTLPLLVYVWRENAVIWYTESLIHSQFVCFSGNPHTSRGNIWACTWIIAMFIMILAIKKRAKLKINACTAHWCLKRMNPANHLLPISIFPLVWEENNFKMKKHLKFYHHDSCKTILYFTQLTSERNASCHVSFRPTDAPNAINIIWQQNHWIEPSGHRASLNAQKKVQTNHKQHFKRNPTDEETVCRNIAVHIQHIWLTERNVNASNAVCNFYLRDSPRHKTSKETSASPRGTRRNPLFWLIQCTLLTTASRTPARANYYLRHHSQTLTFLLSHLLWHEQKQKEKETKQEKPKGRNSPSPRRATPRSVCMKCVCVCE